MDLKEFFKRDRYAVMSGIELLEVAEGRAQTRMVVTQEHLNGVDTTQGGAVFTLADLAFAAACNSHGTVAVAANVNISFARPSFAGDTLTATAREVSCSRRLSNVTVEVTNQKGELVALFQGMAVRKEGSLEKFMAPRVV